MLQFRRSPWGLPLDCLFSAMFRRVMPITTSGIGNPGQISLRWNGSLRFQYQEAWCRCRPDGS